MSAWASASDRRLLGSGAGGRARPGSCTAGRGGADWVPGSGRCGLGRPNYGRDSGTRPPPPTTTGKSAGRARRRQQVTGSGPPALTARNSPGPVRPGLPPHAPCRVCISPEKVFASLPQVERGVSKILGGDPKGDHFLYTNGKCVILRNIDVSTLVPGGACFRPCPASYLQSREILALPPPHLPVGWPGERGATPLLPRSHTLQAQWTGLVVVSSTPTPTPP